jgi:ABC-2 type transport system permease protein
MLAIFKREMKTYLQTPIGYIFSSLFLLVAGILFVLSNLFNLSPSYAPFLSSILFIFLLAIPVLTMRLLTDEKRFHTDQLLLTSSVKITSIVLGKYFAAIVVFLVTIAITILYPVVMSFYGEIDGWESVGSYIGFILLGCSFISIGLFVSATTENQVVAAIVTFVALLVSWFMDFIAQGIPTDPVTGLIFLIAIIAAVSLWIFLSTRNLLLPIVIGAVGIGVALVFFFADQANYVGFVAKVLSWLSLIQRYDSFPRGILKFDAIIYYLTVSAFFVFLTVRVIEKKRWS